MVFAWHMEATSVARQQHSYVLHERTRCISEWGEAWGSKLTPQRPARIRGSAACAAALDTRQP